MHIRPRCLSAETVVEFNCNRTARTTHAGNVDSESREPREDLPFPSQGPISNWENSSSPTSHPRYILAATAPAKRSPMRAARRTAHAHAHVRAHPRACAREFRLLSVPTETWLDLRSSFQCYEQWIIVEREEAERLRGSRWGVYVRANFRSRLRWRECERRVAFGMLLQRWRENLGGSTLLIIFCTNMYLLLCKDDIFFKFRIYNDLLKIFYRLTLPW